MALVCCKSWSFLGLCSWYALLDDGKPWCMCGMLMNCLGWSFVGHELMMWIEPRFRHPWSMKPYIPMANQKSKLDMDD